MKKNKRKMPRRMKWIYALAELQRGEMNVKCPHCGEEALDYGFVMLEKTDKKGYGAIWCNNCHCGYSICRVDLKNESKIIEAIPKEIIYF